MIALLSIQGGIPASRAALPLLKISDNQRFLIREDGRPFFYLGDTAWELFHRLNREEADQYLENRAQLGFTVIQAVALAELDGHSEPNAYGHLPLRDLDPAQPELKDGPNNDYWDHVDYIVNKAESLGLFIGFLPTWGRLWHDNVSNGRPIFNPKNAETYGFWLGQRYQNKAIIWILGGDRSVDTDEQRETLQAMAKGLHRGDGGKHLITFHPAGGSGSSKWFHADEWLSFNMRQNGHGSEYSGHYDQTRADYERVPIKPVLDGEPLYEDHPVSFDAKRFGHSIAADVRRPLYWDLFAGACGHTYGHHSVWQMWKPGRSPINGPLLPWYEAIHQPGASQMRYAKRLLESRPYLTRIPDDTLIVAGGVPTSMPGAGRYRLVATRDSEGSFAMVYNPSGRPFQVHLERISGQRIKAWWFDPRTGNASHISEFAPAERPTFVSPTPGESLDWVLVLDDASRNFPAPGTQNLAQTRTP